MQLPDFLEPVRQQGFDLFIQKCVGEIAFSGPTYQIEVFDPDSKERFWVFLQLEESRIKDVFCSCDTSTETGVCSHMAASCFAVFNSHKKALHERFQASFWFRLFFSMSEKCKTSPPVIKKTARGYEVMTADGDRLFTASEAFSTFSDKKSEETEETSIKFSNLPEEELERWRTGRPSSRLKFELSLFSDLAKWLFSKEDVFVTFADKEIVIDARVLKLHVPLTQNELFELVPTLNTIKGSLKLFEEEIVDVAFDPKRKSFFVDKAVMPPKDAKSFGGWLYVENVGFWPKLAKKSRVELIAAEDIQELFSDALPLLKERLSDTAFYDSPITTKTNLYFDKKKAFHIQSYLETPGDLEGQSCVWGNWAYIPKKGFVAIVPLKFASAHLVIEPKDIGQFIVANRTYLAQFPGFTVHIAKLEEEIVYDVDVSGDLTFHSILQTFAANKERIDLGKWMYVVDDGFYIQHDASESPALPLGEPIFRHSIADFIRRHQDILHAVPNFFAKICPISEVGIQVRLKSRGVIEILPEYSWHDPKDKKRALFYDEFVFVPGKGFYRLAAHLRPLHFAKTVKQDDPEAWSAFFAEGLPKLKREFLCTVDPRLEMPEHLALTVVPQGAAGKMPSDYDLDVYWKSTAGQIPLADLIASKKRKERFIPTDAGLVDLSDDRFHWLDQFTTKSKALKGASKGLYRFDSRDFLRVSSYDTIYVESTNEAVKRGFNEVLERLLNLTPTEPPVQSELNCELRSYQRHGVEWLWFLYQYRLSGLLCDDMGVGKTHQAMGLMDAVTYANRQEGKTSRFLVICPTSLVYHWQDKLKQFLPHFKVKSYVSTQRSLSDFPGDFDLLLTTYGIWRNEWSEMKNYHFDAAFFDELQIAKNHISQIHAALLHVSAEMKVGLTGTPIENQLRELKAIFDLVMPGYMPKDSDFREFFIRPIEKMEKPERKKLLSRYVRPFVLRRRKADVLPDLPEKTEEICVTELVGEQKSLYRHVASQQAMPLIQQLKDETAPIPYMHIFALISSLKQICNHPAIYLKDVANFERYESGKWESFIELLEEAMESEQKVVVFSQYLGMLDIIEAHLRKVGVGFAQIRGQTKNRGDEVSRFQTDPDCKVFLGSLQAAGLGIDLTSASVVIHYDRWWNAARENQATDRVHRFGQVRGVQVFKMCTKQTIEERIDKMIYKKAELLEDVVFCDDHQIVKRLNRQEIISLLEGFPEE